MAELHEPKRSANARRSVVELGPTIRLAKCGARARPRSLVLAGDAAPAARDDREPGLASAVPERRT